VLRWRKRLADRGACSGIQLADDAVVMKKRTNRGSVPMAANRHSIVRVAKSSAGVGAWAGGVFGLLMGGSFPWVPGAGPMIVASPLEAVLLGSLEGAATGAAMGALVGSLLGLGIYDILKHEPSLKPGERFEIYQLPADDLKNTPDEPAQRRREDDARWRGSDLQRTFDRARQYHPHRN
jgi:hypothetical protein